jgi:hypothetical protein
VPSGEIATLWASFESKRWFSGGDTGIIDNIRCAVGLSDRAAIPVAATATATPAQSVRSTRLGCATNGAEELNPTRLTDPVKQQEQVVGGLETILWILRETRSPDSRVRRNRRLSVALPAEVKSLRIAPIRFADSHRERLCGPWASRTTRTRTRRCRFLSASFLRPAGRHILERPEHRTTFGQRPATVAWGRRGPSSLPVPGGWPIRSSLNRSQVVLRRPSSTSRCPASSRDGRSASVRLIERTSDRRDLGEDLDEGTGPLNRAASVSPSIYSITR